jgi:DNA topoisomerase IA
VLGTQSRRNLLKPQVDPLSRKSGTTPYYGFDMNRKEPMETQIRKEMEKMLELLSENERANNPLLKKFTQKIQIEMMRMRAFEKSAAKPKEGSLEVSAYGN